MKLPSNVSQSVQIALEEDIATGDVTADLIPLDETSKATIICRDKAVIAGTAWLDEAFRQIDNSVIVQWYVKDGDHVEQDTILCRVQGAPLSTQ